MVRVAGENSRRTIDLLGKHDAGELVGERDKTEREEEVGALAGSSGPAVGRADGEYQPLDATSNHANARCARRNPPT